MLPTSFSHPSRFPTQPPPSVGHSITPLQHAQHPAHPPSSASSALPAPSPSSYFTSGGGGGGGGGSQSFPSASSSTVIYQGRAYSVTMTWRYLEFLVQTMPQDFACIADLFSRSSATDTEAPTSQRPFKRDLNLLETALRRLETTVGISRSAIFQQVADATIRQHQQQRLQATSGTAPATGLPSLGPVQGSLPLPQAPGGVRPGGARTTPVEPHRLRVLLPERNRGGSPLATSPVTATSPTAPSPPVASALSVGFRPHSTPPSVTHAGTSHLQSVEPRSSVLPRLCNSPVPSAPSRPLAVGGTPLSAPVGSLSGNRGYPVPPGHASVYGRPSHVAHLDSSAPLVSRPPLQQDRLPQQPQSRQQPTTSATGPPFFQPLTQNQASAPLPSALQPSAFSRGIPHPTRMTLPDATQRLHPPRPPLHTALPSPSCSSTPRPPLPKTPAGNLPPPHSNTSTSAAGAARAEPLVIHQLRSLGTQNPTVFQEEERCATVLLEFLKIWLNAFWTQVLAVSLKRVDCPPSACDGAVRDDLIHLTHLEQLKALRQTYAAHFNGGQGGPGPPSPAPPSSSSSSAQTTAPSRPSQQLVTKTTTEKPSSSRDATASVPSLDTLKELGLGEPFFPGFSPSKEDSSPAVHKEAAGAASAGPHAPPQKAAEASARETSAVRRKQGQLTREVSVEDVITVLGRLPEPPLWGGDILPNPATLPLTLRVELLRFFQHVLTVAPATRRGGGRSSSKDPNSATGNGIPALFDGQLIATRPFSSDRVISKLPNATTMESSRRGNTILSPSETPRRKFTDIWAERLAPAVTAPGIPSSSCSLTPSLFPSSQASSKEQATGSATETPSPGGTRASGRTEGSTIGAASNTVGSRQLKSKRKRTPTPARRLSRAFETSTHPTPPLNLTLPSSRLTLPPISTLLHHSSLIRPLLMSPGSAASWHPSFTPMNTQAFLTSIGNTVPAPPTATTPAPLLPPHTMPSPPPFYSPSPYAPATEALQPTAVPPLRLSTPRGTAPPLRYNTASLPPQGVPAASHGPTLQGPPQGSRPGCPYP